MSHASPIRISGVRDSGSTGWESEPWNNHVEPHLVLRELPWLLTALLSFLGVWRKQLFLFLPYGLISFHELMKSCHYEIKKEEILLNFHRISIMFDQGLPCDLLSPASRILLTIVWEIVISSERWFSGLGMLLVFDLLFLDSFSAPLLIAFFFYCFSEQGPVKK